MSKQVGKELEGMELFESIEHGTNSFNTDLSKTVMTKLPEQHPKTCEGHVEQITGLRLKVLVEAKKANDALDNLKNILRANHDENSAKSCLKSPLTKYEQMIPAVNIEGLEKLLDKDSEQCNEAARTSK